MGYTKREEGSWIEWFMLAISSTGFAGFLPGWILRKPGKGGGTAGASSSFLLQWWLFNRPAWFFILCTVVSFMLGLIAVGIAEEFMLRRWGKRERHTGERVNHDFNETCIDEVHGQFLAALPLWFMPLSGLSESTRLALLVVSFILFRIFDGKKPWPINWIERHYDGTAFGIMIDDTAAGAVAAGLIVLATSITAMFF